MLIIFIFEKLYQIFLKNYSRKHKSCTKIYIYKKYTKVSIKAYLINYK